MPTAAPSDLETPNRDVLAFRQARQGGARSHAYATLLGLRTYDAPSLLRKMEKGFAYRSFDHLRRNLGLSAAGLAEAAGIRPRTLTRRKEQGRLQPDESDRLLRISRLFGRALELFEGDAAAARAWLAAPQSALGSAAPLELARTELGAREVERLIGRLEHGVFS